MSAKLNLITGKIIGAEKGSFAWWHEKGHIEYDNSEVGIKNTYLAEMWFFVAVTMAILSIPFRLIWILSFLSIFMFWYYYFFEERWCNRYASIKLKRGGKNV